MRTDTAIRRAIQALLAIQLVTTLAAVALLARMTPAVERILRENVVSLEAVEQMLHDLGAHRPEGFEGALARAEANVTEPEERPLLEIIRQEDDAAFAGEPRAREAVRDALLGLGAVNRASMVRADQRAQGLGTAGASLVVILGLSAFLASAAVASRARRHLLVPLLDATGTLEAALGGDGFRRAATHYRLQELSALCRGLNRLLDERALGPAPEAARAARAERAALERVLGQRPEPWVLLDGRGDVVVSNPAAREVLLGVEGAAWRSALGAEDPERPVHREALTGGAGTLCRLGSRPAA